MVKGERVILVKVVMKHEWLVAVNSFLKNDALTNRDATATRESYVEATKKNVVGKLQEARLNVTMRADAIL